MQTSKDTLQPLRYAILLAGGSGTRLWPLSRLTLPKQLLSLNGQQTLLQESAQRLLKGVSPARIITVTHTDLRFEVMGQLHGICAPMSDRLLLEPLSRNTLPAIAWAVATIAAENPCAVVGVYPSDHSIKDADAFYNALEKAEHAAQKGWIALFGISPTEAATGYGYIKRGRTLGEANKDIYQVEAFVEKPDRVRAALYCARSDYYWNSGIFVFRADVFLEELKKYQPGIYETAMCLASEGKRASLNRYEPLPNLSVDYGLIEKSDRIAVVPAEMAWSDLGNWETVYQDSPKDQSHNTIKGDVVSLSSSGNLLWSEAGVLAAFGVDNLAVIQTRDATLVSSREKVGDLKHLIEELKEAHPHIVEDHVNVSRPWGHYTVLETGPCYKVKRIEVNPGAKLSMQLHQHRSEHWVVISGEALVTSGETQMRLQKGQSSYVPQACRHRLENPGNELLQIIEIQIGSHLSEEDIVRFDDEYGR